ncbi:anti-sigma factor domain-containing protein [Moorellaceae bacterium AZ2]
MAGAERGVVLEGRGRRVIVLTPEGEFRQVRLAGPLPQVGEEIMLSPPTSQGFRWQKMVAVAAVLLFIVLVAPWAAFLFRGPREVAYYISVDINPSIELAVNSRERVIEARAFNPDGEALLQGLHLKNTEVQRAIAELAREAVRRGYYQAQEEGVLLLAVVPVTNAEEGLEAGENLAARLTTTVEKTLQENKIIPVVQAVTLKPALREHASQAGLSSGKYAVLLEALAEGVTVSGESLKQQRVVDVLQKSGADWQKVLRSLGGHNNLEEKERRVKPLLEKALDSNVKYDPAAAGPSKQGRGEERDGLSGSPLKSSPSTPARTGDVEILEVTREEGQKDKGGLETEGHQPSEANKAQENKGRPVMGEDYNETPGGAEVSKGSMSSSQGKKEPKGLRGKN